MSEPAPATTFYITNGVGELDCSGTYSPPDDLQATAHIRSLDKYKDLYQRSLTDAKFWSEISKDFYWQSPSNLADEGVLKYNFDVRNGPIFTHFMEGAKTNLCFNCLDRHVNSGLADKIAFYWEGNEPTECSSITYGNLLNSVCKFANVLKKKGIQKGDRVAIYLPMILELPIALLACARIGAIHSVIFGGFSSESLASRIIDASAKLLITCDGSYRGPKLITLKALADDALRICTERGHSVNHCIVVQHVGRSTGRKEVAESHPYTPPFNTAVDSWHHELMETVDAVCTVEWMDSEDPLFMLYTSGSTGKPKGVLHSHAGYMIYAATTFKYVFDYQSDDVYWCTADVGWITGHSYVVYGPLLNGATGVVFEGTPFHPDAGRFWSVIQKLNVTKFYTAPTAIRALMKFGDSHVTKYDRSSLKVLGTVGEPINPEAWLWYYNIVGDCRCAIVDTYWQTETGGHVITALPGAIPTKPGSATLPFFGVEPAILSEDGTEIEGVGEGYLVFKRPWPGIMRTVYGDHRRFEETYFKKFPGYFCTMDGCRRDKDGYYWITGRIDDMMNVSGHLLSTAEIESAIVEHKAVAEAAVVSQFHDVKGETPYVFVTLKDGHKFTPQLASELKAKVREKIGAVAIPEIIQNAPGLPKTRSGKIVRRVLRKIACGDRDIGDTSTLSEESVSAVDELFALRLQNLPPCANSK